MSKNYKAIHVGGFSLRTHTLLTLWLTGIYVAKPLEIDHYNQNKLDNSVTNLRITNAGINRKNCRKRKDNTSGVTGVSWNKVKGKWLTVVNRTFIGYFSSIEEAAVAREAYLATHPELGYTPKHGK
jgi:hypothetical protein